MTTNGALAIKTEAAGALMEKVLIGGNLANLSALERLDYYGKLCDSLGLTAITRPFEYIVLNGKLTLYARKDCTDQLRHRDKVSIRLTKREVVDGVYVVTAEASSNGRVDESTGAVAIEGLKGEAKANAMMKAETKAKRRVTLSFCGLGFLDESEIEDVEFPEVIPQALSVEASELAEADDAEMMEIQRKLEQQHAPKAETPKAQPATIVDPTDKKPTERKAEPARETSRPVTVPVPDDKTWTTEQWADIAAYFESSDDLMKLRGAVTESMKYGKALTGLNAIGRRVFIERAIHAATKAGFKLEVF